jgi:hypothetical protein
MISSKKLLKIAEILKDSNLNNKLFNCKSKQTAINFIYKELDKQNLLKGFFKDTDWKNIMNIFNHIKNLGVDL